MLKRTVLVVEDNEINREMLTAILSSEYRVLEAENGQEALSLLEQYKEGISLVFLDFTPLDPALAQIVNNSLTSILLSQFVKHDRHVLSNFHSRIPLKSILKNIGVLSAGNYPCLLKNPKPFPTFSI